MKTLSLIFPYYKNPKMLEYQLSFLASYPVSVRKEIELIVVDDGSPIGQRAAEVLVSAPNPDFLRCVRIVVDLPWNHCGARNLGAHVASGKWLMWTDIDHIVKWELVVELMALISAGAINEETIYSFNRIKHGTGEVNHPHAETRLMTRRMFDRTGWFDESFSGHYAFADREYFKRITDAGFRQECFDGTPLERVDSNQIADAKTFGLPRTAESDHVAYAQIKEWKKTIANRIETLKLPWVEERV